MPRTRQIPSKSFPGFVLPFLLCLLCAAPSALDAAQPATVVYRGEAPPSASGPARRIELRLRGDGHATWVTDLRNNRSPAIEEGRWNPLTVDEIEIIVDRRDGKPMEPFTVRMLRQGESLRTTPASSLQFGGEGLTLTRSSSAPAAATPTPVVGATSPVGRTWRWESLIATAEKIVVEHPERYTLQLQAGGKALVRADCNRGQATWQSDGRGISLKLGGLTRAACPADSLSGRYVQALESAVSQRMRGDNLYLDLSGEAGTMKFVREK
jgi:heat shock protein HslJ